MLGVLMYISHYSTSMSTVQCKAGYSVTIESIVQSLHTVYTLYASVCEYP